MQPGHTVINLLHSDDVDEEATQLIVVFMSENQVNCPLLAIGDANPQPT